MPRSPYRKQAAISFYLAEPRLGEEATFKIGGFPYGEVLSTIENLDLSTGEYHVKVGLFESEIFCVVEGVSIPLLVAYSKDMYASVMTERKGEIREIRMEDGEGILDSTYVGFFPGGVAGVLRTSTKSPGATRIANWASLFGGYPFHLSQLTADVLSRLDQHPNDVSGVFLRASKSRMRAIGASSRSGVAEALIAVSEATTSSKVGITMAVERKHEKAKWWAEMKDYLSDLVEVLPEFDRARIDLVGGGRISLLDAYLTTRVFVDMDGTRRVQAIDAARALREAYQESEYQIQLALSRRVESQ